MRRTHSRRVLPAVGAVLLLAATLPFVALTPATPAAAATFDPILSTVLEQPASSARTVADNQGTFHAVVDVGNGLEVQYQRSATGGKVWAPAARFRGEAGGAGRAVIAVDGDRLAIGYIGGWCNPANPTSCLTEVPYLVTSLDGGRTWGSSVRLADAFTSDIQVAVDDDRVWVAFTSGQVELRGTADGGRTFFASRSLPAYYGASLAAADRVMVLAYNGLDDHLGPVVPRAVVADQRTLGPTQNLPGGYVLGGWQSSAAAAEGRVHVLLRNSTTQQPAVVTAGPTGAFAAPVPVGAPGYSTSIAARRGSVGVAIGGDDGVTSVAMSSNFGASYSAPVPVSYTEGGEPLVALGAAQLTIDRPMARFDWSVPDRFVDEDSDGLPEPANFSDDPALDGLRVYAGRTLHVTLDACGSRFGPGRTAASYTWFVDGAQHATGTACQTTLDVDDGDAPSVRLEIRNDIGEIDSITQDVAPRDLLVVSIGDSIASGEGSPHVNGDAAAPTLPTWRDRSCHRSAYAGPSLAARQMEVADRRSSVTFIQLACSGAAMLDVPDVPGSDDDPDTGGLLDKYDGVEMLTPKLRDSQLDQLAELAGTRAVDALLVSIGANDAKFSDVILECIKETGCHTGAARDGFDQRAAELPSRYARLADAIVDLGVRSADVYLTEYFDPTIDDYGLPSLRCIGQDPDFAAMVHFGIQHPNLFPFLGVIVSVLQAFELLDDDEARWAHEDVMGTLNAAARAATGNHGWTYVGGIAGGFDRHGYCASDPWVVRFGESLITQVDPWGAFHPNRAGQRVYGDAIFASLRAHLLTSDGAYDPLAIQSTDIGDFVVTTSTDTGVTAASVHSTGGQPLPGAVRRIDTADIASGYLGVAGPPAVAGSAAAGAWIQVAHTGFAVTGVTARAAQLFVHPNAAVQSVAIVQAPGDAATMVADRPTLVQADIDADVEGPTVVQVTTKVTATDISNAQTTLVDSVEQVTLKPGFNSVLLPTTATFTASELDSVKAEIEITDPPGAGPNDAWDNAGSATATAATSRALTVAFGPADLGGASLGCPTVKSSAERMVAFSAQAMPVSAAGIDSGLACTPIVALQPNEPGLLRGLLDADELARYMGADAFVLVVPDGWLQAAAGGALGVAAPGIRAVIVEASATDSVLAHELAHTLGLGHTAAVPASGARVDRRQPRQGVDWMVWQVQPKLWTGGATWDRLLGAIGGPENAPEALDFSGGGTWVRGTVSRNPDGSWSATRGRWVRGGTGAAAPPDLDLDELELERMTATQLDANGNPIGAPSPVGLSPAGGQYGAGAGGTEPTDGGFVYASRLNLDPAAVAVELRLDGVVVDTRALTAAPTVTVTTPVAGASIAPGASLTVEWAMADPDGDPLTSAVLISDDGGATFRPLAVDVTGTGLTVPMPADVGGTQVVVRVVTSDGERQAAADSGVFTTPVVGLPEERVVFTNSHYDYAVDVRQWVGGIFTMKPDGSDLEEVPLPAASTYRPDDTNQPGCYQPDDCDIEYYTPAWGPDGRIYFASNLRTPEFGATDPGDVFNAYDITGTHIFSINPDGTDLQRVTGQAYDADWWPLATRASANGVVNDHRCPAPSPDGEHVAWYTVDPNRHVGIWVTERDGDGWLPPVVAFGSGRFAAALLPAGAPAPIDHEGNGNQDDVFLTTHECPRWSADGSTLVAGAHIGYQFVQVGTGQTRNFYGGAIVEFDADGSNLRVVAVDPGAADPTVLIDPISSVDWLPGGNFLVGMIGDASVNLNRNAAFELDAVTGTFTRLTPQPDTTYEERPAALKVGPGGGRWYGALRYGWTPDGSSYFTAGDFAIVDPSTGTTERIDPQYDPPSLNEENFGFDWAFVSPTQQPALTIDPVAAPDDPNAPAEPTGDLVPASSVPAPGAADVEGPSVAPLPSTTVTITAGVTTRVQLLGTGGALVPYVVVPGAAPGAVTVGPADGGGPIPLGALGGQMAFGVGSSPTGTILLTAPTDFAGSVQLLVAPLADPSATTVITVEVAVANLAPVAADDVIDIPAGTASTVDPAFLLANDMDPDAGSPRAALTLAVGPSGLEIVSVTGSTGGRAWLDVDGGVHVQPAAAGTSTFRYVIADAGGATATALVTVRVAADPAPTTPTPTTTAPTAPPTDPPVTTDPAAPATTVAPAATLPSGATAPPATTAAPTAPGTLPVTGANLTAVVAIALGLLVIGVRLRRRARLGEEF